MDMTLDFFPDLQRGKGALVEIDLEMIDVGKWNRYLVGHFLDGKMAYPLLSSTARNQWKELFMAVKPEVAGFYLFEFRDEQVKQQVLEGGPYFFSQKYLVLKDWQRMLKPAMEQPSKSPAWVKLHDLPFELWNKECLSRIASTIGRPLHVDQAIAKSAKQPGLIHTKSSKARICIEINAEHDLPEEVTIVVEGDSVIIPVEYQVLPPMCTICHVFGHSTIQCAKKASTSSSLPKLASQVEIPGGRGTSSLPQQPATQEWAQMKTCPTHQGADRSGWRLGVCLFTMNTEASLRFLLPPIAGPWTSSRCRNLDQYKS
ncbi:hypothetical protein RHMOL_Rhmol04G0214000 [Rhododendron molle]|uniref:Uncharacterized protein n=1 Tax=Rhododendron molle TaxID=49168 RepID=A0ACC0P2P9_RHOML|nr:hypothetical protein RHMOL_Rhmol04G0214000 [Rhododendron molle]